MQIHLTKPDIERFIADQVQAGHYPSPEAVVEAAIADLRAAAGTELDAETIDAINRAEEQLDRGEGIAFEQFAGKMRDKMAAQ